MSMFEEMETEVVCSLGLGCKNTPAVNKDYERWCSDLEIGLERELKIVINHNNNIYMICGYDKDEHCYEWHGIDSINVMVKFDFRSFTAIIRKGVRKLFRV